MDVAWTAAEGFAVGADARLDAPPKFEFGVKGSLAVGVDLDVDDLEPPKPKLEAKESMKGAFDTLVG